MTGRRSVVCASGPASIALAASSIAAMCSAESRCTGLGRAAFRRRRRPAAGLRTLHDLREQRESHVDLSRVAAALAGQRDLAVTRRGDRDGPVGGPARSGGHRARLRGADPLASSRSSATSSTSRSPTTSPRPTRASRCRPPLRTCSSSAGEARRTTGPTACDFAPACCWGPLTTWRRPPRASTAAGPTARKGCCTPMRAITCARRSLRGRRAVERADHIVISAAAADVQDEHGAS